MPVFPRAPISALPAVAVGMLAMTGLGTGTFSLESVSRCLLEGQTAVGRYVVTRTMTSSSNEPVIEKRQVLSGPGIEHEYWLDEAIDSRKLVPARLRSPATSISKEGTDCNHAERFVHREPNGDFLDVEWLVSDQLPRRYLSVTATLAEEWILQERTPASSEIEIDSLPGNAPANGRGPHIFIVATEADR